MDSVTEGLGRFALALVLAGLATALLALCYHR
jgi:hypothetical protein